MADSREEVDLILLHRITATRKCEYLVQWANDQQQTWETGDSLEDTDQLLASYWRGYVERAGASSYLEQSVNVELIKKVVAARVKKSKPVRKPVDKIAVAKRVQASKHLNGSLNRSRRQISSVLVSSSKSPPENAKRSHGALPPTPVSETTSRVRNLDISGSQKRPIQRARKSTGGRRPPVAIQKF
ncbi:hypothetical protein H4R24_002132 [Coemansia sp. RSA 988]|nr:hypothetical protein H4R24_002132 [Coemansia sp. RSA 988]